jgi:aryl-alcohol dehydrogenase-like predicted oxidoreductase
VADLCLAYLRAQDWIDGIVVGMENESQLEANWRLFARESLTADDCERIVRAAPIVPVALLDPAQWPPKKARAA